MGLFNNRFVTSIPNSPLPQGEGLGVRGAPQGEYLMVMGKMLQLYLGPPLSTLTPSPKSKGIPRSLRLSPNLAHHGSRDT